MDEHELDLALRGLVELGILTSDGSRTVVDLSPIATNRQLSDELSRIGRAYHEHQLAHAAAARDDARRAQPQQHEARHDPRDEERREHRAEDFGGFRPVTPDEGVIIQGVGDGRDLAQDGKQPIMRLLRHGREVNAIGGGEIGHQPSLAARAGQRADPRANLGAVDMEELQSLNQFRGRVDLGNPDLTQEGG